MPAVAKRYLGKGAEGAALFHGQTVREFTAAGALPDASRAIPLRAVFRTAPDDDAGGEDRGRLTQRLSIFSNGRLGDEPYIAAARGLYRAPLSLSSQAGAELYDPGIWESVLQRVPSERGVSFLSEPEPAEGAEPYAAGAFPVDDHTARARGVAAWIGGRFEAQLPPRAPAGDVRTRTGLLIEAAIRETAPAYFAGLPDRQVFLQYELAMIGGGETLALAQWFPLDVQGGNPPPGVP